MKTKMNDTKNTKTVVRYLKDKLVSLSMKTATVCIVLPTLNEEKIISQNIDQLFKFCKKNLSNYEWFVVIADNGSTDKTLEIVQQKKNNYHNLYCFHLDQPSKGAAIKKAWHDYPADVNIFMDADLATELKFIPELIKPITQDEYDLVIGSRYSKQSKLNRSILRSFLSRGYNLVLKIVFGLKLSDVHCGFKAVRKKVVKQIIPKVKNNHLFFDTELLVLSHHSKLLIKEVPVNWREQYGRKTKIKLINTAFNYLKELVKLKLRLKKA